LVELGLQKPQMCLLRLPLGLWALHRNNVNGPEPIEGFECKTVSFKGSEFLEVTKLRLPPLFDDLMGQKF
jgi:hypothetical protein